MKKSRTFRPTTIHTFGLIVLLVFGMGLDAQGDDVSVVDKWDKAGYLSVANGALSVVFSQEDGWVRVYDL